MKKLILIGLLSVALFGCEKKATDVSDRFSKPQELADCSFTELQTTIGHTVMVVRCPNSVVSIKEPKGKTSQTTITLDGVEYKKVVE